MEIVAVIGQVGVGIVLVAGVKMKVVIGLVVEVVI